MERKQTSAEEIQLFLQYLGGWPLSRGQCSAMIALKMWQSRRSGGDLLARAGKSGKYLNQEKPEWAR